MEEGLKIELGKQGIFVTTIQELYNWGRRSSIFPMQFGLACCAIEMIATTMARYDLARFGAEIFRPSPRQADLMIISGTVTKKDGAPGCPALQPDGRAQVCDCHGSFVPPSLVDHSSRATTCGEGDRPLYSGRRAYPGLPAAARGAAAGLYDPAKEDRRPAINRRRPPSAASECGGAERVPRCLCKGEHDLEPASNPGVWTVPVVIR